MFKRKGKLSKAYKKVKTINRCTSIRRKILDIDIKPKNHYEKKLLEDEIKIFDKAKANKNVLFNYIKKKQKTFKNIGPFIKNKIVLNEHPSEILRKQFESVFSKPMEKYIVNDPYDFFNGCIQCQREEVHICLEDTNVEIMGNINNIPDIYFSELDTRKSISKIANLTCVL